MDYLLKLGVNSSQLKARGYGESQPLEDCNKCSIEERMINRRSEFVFVK